MTPTLTRILGAGAVALALAGCYGGNREAGQLQGPYSVTRVVDGDTIRVVRDGQEIAVRLIGINTPETVAPGRPVECFGPEASARTKDLVSGSKVWLEYDAVSGELDKYGRTLAYVWMSQDQMLNEELVREGFAQERTYDDGYKYQQRLRAAEDAAQAEGAGLWTACP